MKIRTAKQEQMHLINEQRGRIKDCNAAIYQLKHTDFKRANNIVRMVAQCLDVTYYWMSQHKTVDGKHGVHVHLSVKSADGLKTTALTSVIAYLDALIGNTSSRDYVGEHHAERTFRFGESYYHDLCVSLDVSVQDGEMCRKVKTGTEVQYVDKYEIQCS
jgi:hypothetical protein